MEPRETYPVRGSMVTRGSRRSAVAKSRRVCVARGCETVLSRYNLRPTCYHHAPVSYPRLRGTIGSVGPARVS